MDDFQAIAQILSSGGDVATAFIAWAIWRLDRRVLTLELKGTNNEKLA